MSHPAPMAQFDADAPDPDDVRERHVLLRALKRVRAPIVLLPLLAGLLVAAGVGASKLWAEIPEREPVALDVTCWDRQVRPVEQCTEPTGPFGLRWVFPSFAADDPRCEQVGRPRRAQGRPVEFTCEYRFDQRAVTVTYSRRTSIKTALAALRKRYDAKPRPEADGERLVFASRTAQGGVFATTVAYADHPFVVTVEAPERLLRDDALGELVDFRPAAQVRVRGAAG